jgi:competence protein ComEA
MMFSNFMRRLNHNERHFDRGIMLWRALWTGMIAALIAASAASFHSISAQTTPNKADSENLPDAPGKAVIIRACLPCHNVKVTTAKRATGSAEEWTQVVDKMISQGAELSDDEIDLTVRYLTTYYGPNSPKSTNSHPSETEKMPSTADKASSEAKAHTTAQLHVNKASAAELESSLGLSKDAAETIVRYREQHGNFKNWQELAAVPGVPVEKIKSNQERLVF